MEPMQRDSQVELKLSSEGFMHLEAVRIQPTSRTWASEEIGQLPKMVDTRRDIIDSLMHVPKSILQVLNMEPDK